MDSRIISYGQNKSTVAPRLIQNASRQTRKFTESLSNTQRQSTNLAWKEREGRFGKWIKAHDVDILTVKDAYVN